MRKALCLGAVKGIIVSRWKLYLLSVCGMADAAFFLCTVTRMSVVNRILAEHT